mmetsp:Transcript_50162/g.119420  ORF Transcript_50162/g.119420 Transcript_50162/m.119420 type:complete len:779 (-) Transcript_50162:113-2449(-)
MATSLGRVNPDAVVDKLPFPYRLIQKALEEVLTAVADHIDTVEKERRSSDREYGLPRIAPTQSMSMNSRVTAVHAGPAGMRYPSSWSLAVGTSDGEVLLVDTQKAEVVVHKRPFPEGEGAHSLVLCPGSAFKPLPAPPGSRKNVLPPRQVPRLVVAGTATPKVLCYNIIQENFGGITLRPSCSVSLEAPADSSAPPVHQLHAQSIEGATLVVALLQNRTVCGYLCPLGALEDSTGSSNLAEDTILEEQEVEQEHDASAADEFEGLPVVAMPTYRIDLSLAGSPMSFPSAAEPTLDSLQLMLLGVRMRTAAGAQSPTYLLVWARESPLLAAYSMSSGVPCPVAAEGLELEALLKQTVPEMGFLEPPKEAKALQACRRWTFPSSITATAASPSGWQLAVGTAQGAIGMVETTSTSLRRAVPGHYGSVAALTFHKEDLLVSLGGDGWVHHYNIAQDSVTFRCLMSPTPAAPALAVAASQQAPMSFGLDVSGNIRFFDLHRGRKVAQVVSSLDGLGTSAANSLLDRGKPVQVIDAGRGTFLVVCDQETLQEATTAAAPEPAEDEAQENQDDGEPTPATQLVFLDMDAVLQQLYPGIAARVAKHGLDAMQLFGSLLESELQEAPPEQSSKRERGRSSLERSAGSGSGSQRTGASGTKRRSVSPPAALLESSTSTLATDDAASDMQGSQHQIGALTAENLQRIGGRATSGSLLTVPSQSHNGRALSKQSSALHTDLDKTLSSVAVPENWQAASRHALRNALRNRDVRLNRLSKRMDVLRKELEA